MPDVLHFYELKHTLLELFLKSYPLVPISNTRPQILTLISYVIEQLSTHFEENIVKLTPKE